MHAPGWTLAATGHRVRAAGGPALQAAAAAGIAWYVAHDLLGHSDPFFAPIAAAVALGTSHLQRARRAIQMVVGVLLGIGVSELLQPLVGSGAIGIAAVVMVIVVATVAVSGGFVGEGLMFFNQAASAAVLVIALHHAGTGVERASDALIGGAVALVIGVGLFPADPFKLLARAEERVLQSLFAIIEQCGRPAAGAHDTDVEWALTASHDVHVQLARLSHARSSASVTVRVAPRRMRLRATVAHEQARVSQLHLLAGSVLSLVRAVVDARESRAGESRAGEAGVGGAGAGGLEGSQRDAADRIEELRLCTRRVQRDLTRVLSSAG